MGLVTSFRLLASIELQSIFVDTMSGALNVNA